MTGASSTAATARQLKTINPATERVLKEYETFTQELLTRLVKQARQTFLEWKNNIDRRSEHLYSFAKELRKNKESLAKTATQEMGKAIKEAARPFDIQSQSIFYRDRQKGRQQQPVA